LYPILFSLFGHSIPSWHFFYGLAGLFSYFLAQHLLASYSSKFVSDKFFGLFIVCYVFGWIGARSFSLLTEDFSITNVSSFFLGLFEFGAMTFYGGVIASAIFGIMYLKILKMPVAPYFDACIPAGIFALGIGRLGCFLNGDDFGRPIYTSLTSKNLSYHKPFWAVVFPNLNDNIPRYPTQLLEAAFCFIIIIVFLILLKKSKKFSKIFGQGILASWLVLLSCVNRFFNEFLRGDARGNFFSTDLSTSQGLAILFCILSICYLYIIMRFNKHFVSHRRHNEKIEPDK
jgi:phosphatidylglycerol---prolipoprotein diacylglyceryl transferase